MSSDWECIEQHIMPELLRRAEQWKKEYKQERDLGPLGNFVSLYRKARKLKTALWDSRTLPEDWREDVPTMLYEIMSDAALMLVDLTEGDDAVHRRSAERDFSMCGSACRVPGRHNESSPDCGYNQEG